MKIQWLSWKWTIFIVFQKRKTPENTFILFIFHVCKFWRGEKNRRNAVLKVHQEFVNFYLCLWYIKLFNIWGMLNRNLHGTFCVLQVFYKIELRNHSPYTGISQDSCFVVLDHILIIYLKIFCRIHCYHNLDEVTGKLGSIPELNWPKYNIHDCDILVQVYSKGDKWVVSYVRHLY